MDLSKIPPEEMLPPADKMPSVESIEEAKKLLEEDKLVAIETPITHHWNITLLNSNI